jgi:hypothetical protein
MHGGIKHGVQLVAFPTAQTSNQSLLLALPTARSDQHQPTLMQQYSTSLSLLCLVSKQSDLNILLMVW